MKYMNHIKLGLLAVTFACAGTVFTSCEDDITINAVNTEKQRTSRRGSTTLYPRSAIRYRR